MTCKYKVKIKDIQYNYKVQMTDIQSKYKFKVFCTGYDDSEIKEKIDAMYQAWPKVSGEGETITLNDTANTTMAIDLKGNTSQEGTPTPETPQDIHVVSGDNSINVCGKNLFTNIVYKDNYIINSTGGEAGNTLGCIWEKIKVKPNTTYTLSYSSTDYSFAQRVSEYNSSDTFIQRSTTQTSPYTFTTTSTTEYINLSGFKTDTNIQIELGSQATTYEEYKGASYPINLGDIELCKIGDYQDSIVKDNGKWYLNKQIGKIIFNGTERWTFRVMSGINRFDLVGLNSKSGSAQSNPILCNYFLSKYANEDNVIYLSTNVGALAIMSNNFTDLATFKTWLSNGNVMIYYALQTPTTTEITDSTLISQLEAIKEAESYSGQTNISQTNDDKPFILTAKALKDLSNL